MIKNNRNIRFEWNILNFRAFKNKYGDHFFEKGALSAVQEYCHSLDEYHSSKVEKFRDSNGNIVDRTIAYVENVQEFVKKISSGRGIKKPELVLSSDAGQGKLIVTLSVFQDADTGEENEDEDFEIEIGDPRSPNSNQRIFLLCVVDDVPEKYENMMIIFEVTNKWPCNNYKSEVEAYQENVLLT